MAQAEGAEIMRRQRLVDSWSSAAILSTAPRMEARVRSGKTALDTDFPEGRQIRKAQRAAARAKRAPSAFLNRAGRVRQVLPPSAFGAPIPAGCRSLAPCNPLLLTEARELRRTRAARSHFCWVKNVNAYHGVAAEGRGIHAARLIQEFGQDRRAGTDPLYNQPPQRHGRRADRGHRARSDKLMPYLAPAGSIGVPIRILKRMNRKPHRRKLFLRLIERIRAATGPDIRDVVAISSSGFPEEDRADSRPRMELVREVQIRMMLIRSNIRPAPATPAAERPQVEAPSPTRACNVCKGCITGQQREIQNSMVA